MERKKRYVKERRKLILEESIILFPQRNKFDIQQAKRAKYGLIHPEDNEPSSQRKLKNGIGKRLNLKEMLQLQKLTRAQTMSHLGLSHLPPGTKAPPS